MIDINLKHILCPVDFSECSRHAFDQAVAIARRRGADVTVLHVLPVPSAVPALPYGPEGPGPFGFETVTRDRALAELKRFLATEDAVGVPSISRLPNRRTSTGKFFSRPPGRPLISW